MTEGEKREKPYNSAIQILVSQRLCGKEEGREEF